MIVIRQMTKEELECARDIDVSESDDYHYRCVNGQLETVQQGWTRGNWDAVTWQETLADWDSYLGMDVILGAFVGEQLVGLASLSYGKTPTVAQLVSIHVSQPYRRHGIGAQLMQVLMGIARNQGVTRLYVWATNSPSAVNFYLNQGFQPVQPGSEFYTGEVLEDFPMIVDL